ncbi:SURF1 family protein [Nocardioides sp. zg-536]|uniref:SURF1-like protein n=1 Tax=Nocardioides faecalis TaxID=2803858 RepID=A0A938Y0I6_9ACTN|nr:SURF1 family protein [Nocardioides faecalis]MBM9459917.1 SURF1 family protein [Nocardioides faecalis]MBS4753219.1 SURF1 family protein [Nocardioides faecalis]QVI58854.1 SURF1 family protein [Nocardioides faecalis]
MSESSKLRPWSPRLWGVHLLGLLCVGFAVGMGLWQYDAFTERRAAEQQDLTRSEPVAITELMGPDDPFPRAGLSHPVEVRGTFLPEGTVLIDDREGAGGRDGRWLVTPITVGEPGAPAVPVIRGWVDDDTDLDELPAPPTGEVDVLGWLQPTEGGNDPDEDPTDDIVPLLRVADLLQRVEPGQDMYGAFVLAKEPLATDEEAGVVAATLDQLPPASRFTGLRNILYAVEWWVFAAFAAFIWWRHVRDVVAGTTHARRVVQTDDEDTETDVVGSRT